MVYITSFYWQINKDALPFSRPSSLKLPVLSEADVEEGLTWHVRGPLMLYLLCDNFISVASRERGTAKDLFDFYKHKNAHVW